MRGPARGFTLLEILLVAMLMGLVATAVTLGMGAAQGDRTLERQHGRLWAALQQAQELAIMEGRLVGLRVDEQGWQFMLRQGAKRQWQGIADDPLLARNDLPAGLRLSLELEGFDALTEPAEEQGGDRPPSPQILLFPGGELTPFVLTLESDGDQHLRRLQGNEFGQISLVAEAE